MAFKDYGVMNSYRIAKTYIFDSIKELYAITESSPDSVFDTVRVGDSPSDYFEVESDGTFVLRGSATVWDDLVGSLIARRLTSTAGGLHYEYAESAIVMDAGGSISDQNDRLIFNLQYPHACVVDGGMHLHIHWEQTDAIDREFTVQYRVQTNGTDKVTTWQTVVVGTNANNAFTYTSGTFNQITELAIVDLTGAGISATVQFRLARTDSVGGDILATFVDAHVLRDTMGSRSEYVK